MDDFKRNSLKEVGPAGLKCPCCSPYNGKPHQKKKFKKRIRARTKQQTKMEVLEALEYEECEDDNYE